ncbi:FtsK/SpoIIIE domain-containing protein [Micromonospora inyonensis]|uniref:FtsK/SpoIIIE family protein n=1 Tax=Micromonospora inyonensis TaxID=47866 RepID=A0A1C6RCI6_9ACTN|nr:FtsK/SpoIIIE domain-containing protein [Micromonospora inyonensis]SCL14817.1 FtsK/SpoIIIE family protein [Micromonospora inyonensis]
MANIKGPASRAAALHRRAAATTAAAATILDDTRPVPADQRRQYELADRLRRAAEALAPGWAGAALDSLTPDVPPGDEVPPFVRVGTAAPLDDARFPALVPLPGTGHLVIDTDVSDPRVAGLLRAVLLRLLAASPAGSLLVRAVDGATGTPPHVSATAPAGTPPRVSARASTAATADTLATGTPGATSHPPAEGRPGPTADPRVTGGPGPTADGSADDGPPAPTESADGRARASTGPEGDSAPAPVDPAGGSTRAPSGSSGIPTPVDSGGTGTVAERTSQTFAGFAPLADAGLLPPPATDPAGLRAVLSEAEQWVASGTARQRRHDRTMLLVIAALPPGVESHDLARIEALARCGHRAGLHLVVAGWPPSAAGHPPLASATNTNTNGDGTTRSRAPGPAIVPTAPDAGRTGAATLPHATEIAIRNAYALLGDPPGTSFASPGADPPTGLNSPVLVEDDPPAGLVEAVCRRLARRVAAGAQLTLATLLPPADAPRWETSSATGLATVVGDADGRTVTLGLTELTPHWLISGRAGSGRADFLTNVLFGLAARYGPDELIMHLVDLADGESFTEFLQTRRDRSWVPQVATAALAADREYVQSLFGHLEAELRRREEAGHRAGGQRFVELRQHQTLPRIVCVIDNVSLLFRDGRPGHRPGQRDRLGVDLAGRLETLARAGRAYGIHLVLAGEGDLGLAAGAASRDSVLGQFPVRVALPGGGAVLEPTNDAAAGLAVGSAVVNTAGGLGGPRGATRGHERMVRFPDPLDDPASLAALRRDLWAARPAGSSPPVVFAGYARPVLRNDPCYRAAEAGRARTPAALLGRAVDVSRSTVSVPLVPVAGRNLVVLGTGPESASLLASIVRSVAAHHGSGSARFVVAALTRNAGDVAAALAAELAARHTVETVDLSGLLAVLDDEHPGYLVLFGADGPGGVPDGPLRALLRDGPPTGRHVLGWWRSASAFGALLDPDDGVGKVASVVVVDVPANQLTPIVGRPVQWSPRPGRALLWDGSDGSGTVLVPFATDGDGEAG